jgi:hypothetical protein
VIRARSALTLGALAVALCATVALSACASVSTSDGPALEPSVPPTLAAPTQDAAASTRPASGTTREPRRRTKIPETIDATGSRDVHTELQEFVNQVPDGTAIVFKAGGRYRMERALWINGKRNLTLEGHGARIDLPRADLGWGGMGFHVSNSTGTIIRNLTMVGNNNQAGTSAACCSREGQHGIAVLSSDETLIENVDIRRIWGDCVYVRHFDEQHGDWSDGLTIRDSTCRLTGRMGVTINAGKNVQIDNNVFDDIGYAVIAIEPNSAEEGATGVAIRNNTVGRYSLTDNYKGALFYACDAPWGGGAVVRDVTVSGNTVAGNASGKDGKMVGLNLMVCDNGVRENFTVTNNTASRSVAGPVMQFKGVKGVTVTGNSQPLSSGSLATFSGSTNVTYDG